MTVGPILYKLAETARVFVRSAPDPRGLWASRHPTFERAHVILPSTAAAGEQLAMTVQARDAHERLFRAFEGTFAVESTDPDADLPDSVALSPDDEGVVRATVGFETPGIQYVTLHPETGVLADEDRQFVSNPVEVHEGEPDERLYWGDIHLHSQFSDGAGAMEKGLRFGRDTMALDVAAYTDHDTMGFFIPPSLQRRRMHGRYFEEMKALTEAFNAPGEFVTLFGYEWTKQPNVGGHVNVYFDGVDDAELFDSLSEETRTYEKLWARLREWRDEADREVVTVPHHPAEAMYPFDFSAMAYDDELAPLVEVYSQWGSSERPGGEGNTKPLQMGQGEVGEPGHYVQDALAMGNRVGLVASSDYHGPHPGHSLIHAPPHLPRLDEWREDGVGWGLIWRVWNERSYPGGLVAFRAPELTREAIFESLRTRRVYGTSQPHRILVDFAVEGTRVGEADSTVTVARPDAPRTVSVSVAGTAPVARVTVVKNNEPWQALEGTDDPDAPLEAYTVSGTFTDESPVAGLRWDDDRGTDADVYYVRVRQAGADDRTAGMAWAGPIWVEVE